MTPDAAELVRRLRDQRQYEYLEGQAVAMHGDPLCEEAADAIEQLQREVVGWCQQFAAAEATIERQRAVIETILAKCESDDDPEGILFDVANLAYQSLGKSDPRIDAARRELRDQP